MFGQSNGRMPEIGTGVAKEIPELVLDAVEEGELEAEVGEPVLDAAELEPVATLVIGELVTVDATDAELEPVAALAMGELVIVDATEMELEKG